MITVKSAGEVEVMARAGAIVVDALREARRRAEPGNTTAALDRAVRKAIEGAGAKAAFLGYMGFPASSCISLNAEVVHGIPSPDRILAEGDLVSVDVGVLLDGYYADAAFTVALGDAAPELLACGRRCLDNAVAQCRVGTRLGDVSHGIEETARGDGFDVVREYVGHGIGTKMHEEPQVPNYGVPGRGPRLVAGMALALEPMVVAGDWRTAVSRDKWTVVTRDGALSAHFEHTVVITDDEPRVLTRGWEEFV
ncbi:MAG TPA: type I methionyl aminopeptidase [bacterium]|nr:type I methionyl aminopeptidase [bacterium]